VQQLKLRIEYPCEARQTLVFFMLLLQPILHRGHSLESLASADDARRCRLLLLLLHVYGGSSQHVGQATQQALEDSARLLAQWLGD